MKVTGDAVRPAGPPDACTYCREPVGGEHGPKCVLAKKTVKIRMVVEYDIEVPEFWDTHQTEFHRNDGSWCANNALDELKALEGCLCHHAKFEVVKSAESSEDA